MKDAPPMRCSSRFSGSPSKKGRRTDMCAQRDPLRRIYRGEFTKVFLVLTVVLSALLFAPMSYAEYSTGPRQTGEEVLLELLVCPTRFMVRVASNGCTDKDSFKVDVKKEAGLSPKVPHYLLTIVRVRPDECKAIIDDGVLLLFDLARDVGLTGDFTYSITNPVYSLSRVQPSENSLLSIIERYFTLEPPRSGGAEPEPFTEFSMDHGYFTCYLPTRWKLERDPEGDEKAGIFEVRLTASEKAKPEDGESYFFPDPLIYVGYYRKDNQQNKTYESFIKDYEELLLRREGSDRSRYEKPKEIEFGGREATEITYEVYQEVPRGPLVTIECWLKARFIVVKGDEGFYVLAYKSPQEFYDEYSHVFEEVVETFEIGGTNP